MTLKLTSARSGSAHRKAALVVVIKAGIAKLAAQKIIKLFPDSSAKSLARRLKADLNHANTLESCRSIVRRALGQNGAGRRPLAKKEQLTRPARKPGEQRPRPPEMPQSLASAWSPFTLGVTGQVGILSDIHVPYHSPKALAASVKHLKTLGLKALILNGDFADFYSISRWVKNPAKRDFGGELKAVRELIGWLRAEFPRIPIIAKLGNHEERWEHWLWDHAPEISGETEMGLDAWLHLNRNGVELVKDQRIILAGELPIAHGHELPKGMASPVNAARGAFMRTMSTILIGHGHRTSGHCEQDMWQSETFCWSTGCLCDLAPEYARINKWNWGFASVQIAKTGGGFDVSNYRITGDGKVRSS